MSNPFKKINKEEIKSGGDFLGGSFLLESGVYEAEVLFAYLSKATHSEAQAVNLILKVDNGTPKGMELRFQEWVSNKSNEVFYVDKQTKEKKYLPGYEKINDLALLTTGKEMDEQEVDERIAKIWDPEVRAEVNKAVNCFVEMHGEKVKVAIQKVKRNKTKKNDSTGTYDPIDEAREENEIIKFFSIETDKTVSETLADLPEAVFMDAWREKNTGVTRDLFKSVSGGASGSGIPKASGSAQTPSKSLFNKK